MIALYTEVVGVEDVKFNPCLPCDEDHEINVIKNQEWGFKLKKKDYDRICNLPEGQGKSMFLTQPIMSSITVACLATGSVDSLRNEAGVTVAEFVKSVKIVLQELVRDDLPEELWLYACVK